MNNENQKPGVWTAPPYVNSQSGVESNVYPSAPPPPYNPSYNYENTAPVISTWHPVDTTAVRRKKRIAMIIFGSIFITMVIIIVTVFLVQKKAFDDEWAEIEKKRSKLWP